MSSLSTVIDGAHDGPTMAVVGGRSLAEKLPLIDWLIKSNIVDALMLGPCLAPLFERVRRESWERERSNNAASSADAGEGGEPASTEEAPEGSEFGGSEDGEDALDEDVEEVEKDTSPMLTDEESVMLPTVRYLHNQAKLQGVILHLPSDYVLGDEAPVSADQGDGTYSADYDGEVSEFAVPGVATEPGSDDAAGASGDAAKANGDGVEGEEDDEDEDDEMVDKSGARYIRRKRYGMVAYDAHVLDIGPDTQEKWEQRCEAQRQYYLWMESVLCSIRISWLEAKQSLMRWSPRRLKMVHWQLLSEVSSLEHFAQLALTKMILVSSAEALLRLSTSSSWAVFQG